MSYPVNPDTIILKNKFYPRGLKEVDIWNYYQRVKGPLLKEVMNRDLMFFIMVEENKPIIKRKLKDKFIRLTPANYDTMITGRTLSNYDTMITGRTLSIHSAMNIMENFGIIDIDIHPNDGFAWARKVTADVYDFVMDEMPVVQTTQIRFTGKQSFHIVCKFGRKMKIDSIRFLLQKFLRQSDLSRVYTIEGKRRSGVPNLDMAPNKFRGNYITLNSLSVWGLKCIELPYNKLMTFDPRKARI